MREGISTAKARNFIPTLKLTDEANPHIGKKKKPDQSRSGFPFAPTQISSITKGIEDKYP